MFAFLVKYFGFLKHVPLLPHLVDAWMKIYGFLRKPWLIQTIEEIEKEISEWQGVQVGLHKYGGLEFRFNNREFGHIHSNGILDILFTRAIKEKVIQAYHAKEHHVFPLSGWISFYINSISDKEYALELLKLSYTNALAKDHV